MKTTSIEQMVIRIAGMILIVLGFIIWPGNSDFLIPVHILIGSVLVIALLTLSYQSARLKISNGLIIFAVVWAFMLPILGLTQESLLPETSHWIIQVLHLLFGVVAIGVAELLGTQIHKKSSLTAQ
jgi:hypothetical protein